MSNLIWYFFQARSIISRRKCFRVKWFSLYFKLKMFNICDFVESEMLRLNISVISEKMLSNFTTVVLRVTKLYSFCDYWPTLYNGRWFMTSVRYTFQQKCILLHLLATNEDIRRFHFDVNRPAFVLFSLFLPYKISYICQNFLFRWHFTEAIIFNVQ